MINIHKTIITLICLILPLVFVACASSKVSNDNKQIYIAVMGSKQVYDYDQSFLNGIKLAIDECTNELSNEGYSFTYNVFDDEYNFEKGMVISKKLSSDPQVTAILGTHSISILDSTVQEFENSKKILIAANGMMDSSIVGKKYDFIFRNTIGEKAMGAYIADYALKTNINRLAIYSSETQFEKNIVVSFCKRILENDGTILDVVSPVASKKDFDSIYRRWDAIGVDGVLISCESISDAFTAVEFIRSNSNKIAIYGDFSFDAEKKLVDYKSYVEGIVIPTLVPIHKTDELLSFNNYYKEIYGETPTWWAAHAYDSVRMIIDAAVSVGSNDTELIAKKLHSKSGYRGVTGDIVFDESGLLMGRTPVYTMVKDGKLVKID